MPLGPYYYNTYAWSKPLTFQDLAATIKQEPEGIPPGELTSLSGKTSPPSQLRGQSKDVIFFDEVQESPKKSRYDEFLESMGGKKIENPCGEIEIQAYPSIQIDEPKSRRWDLIDRVTQIAKQEMQAAEDVRVFKMMDTITNPHIDEIEKANEIMNQKTKEAEKIIQNPDYEVVKRNCEPVQELYSGTWNADYLELPKSLQEKQAIEKPATDSNVTPSIYQSTTATENLELPKEKYYTGGDVVIDPGGNLALGEPGIIKSDQEHVLTFDPVTSTWASKKVEDNKKIFDSKGELNATSLKDALQNLMKYAKILEENELKNSEVPKKMKDKFMGGETLKHPIESNTYFEPSYVTAGADPSAKVKQIIDSATKDELITSVINSQAGKVALAQAMAEPLRRNLNYHEIARAAFPIEQMGAAPSSLTYERTDRSQIMGSSDINELRQTITNIEDSLDLKDKKKRRRRKMASINPLFLFTLAAAGAGIAHATKSKVSNEDIKVRQINE